MPDRNNIIFLLLLFLLVCIAFTVRFKGVWFGYPLPVHPDEPVLVNIALRMITTGDLNPHFFNYPTLNIYLQALIFRLVRLFSGLFLDRSPAEIPVIWYYIAGRTFNVFISVLTIIATFIIGKRLISSLAGLLASFFLAFSYLHIRNSFLLTVDTSVALWASLATLMAVLIYTEGKQTKYYVLGGIFVGLAISSKYTAFVAVAPLLIAHYSKVRGKNIWLDEGLIMGLIAIPVAFLLTTPYALLDFGNFLHALRIEAEHYSSGHPGAQSETTTSYYLYWRHLFYKGYGIAPMIFAGLGFMWLLLKTPWKASIIAATPILLYIFVGRYKVYFPRNVVAVVPFLSLLSGSFIYFAYKAFTERLPVSSKTIRLTVSSLSLVAILLASVWNQTIDTVKYVERITLPDTRWVSLKWIEKSLIPGSRIGREHYTPPIENYTRIFDVVYLGFFGAIKRPQYLEDLDYVIVSSGDYLRFLQRPQTYPDESRAYTEFFAKHELVKEFVADNDKLGGPRISIYRLRH